MDEPSTIEVGGEKYLRALVKFEAGGIIYEICRHPELMIDEEVLAWYREYEWVKQGGSQVEYRLTNPKYHIAAGIFEVYYNRFARQVKK